MRRIIRKFAQNKHTEISNTEATLIPCGSPGGAGQKIENIESLMIFTLSPMHCNFYFITLGR